jgi:DNA-binding transcriptional LysR family regulator
LAGRRAESGDAGSISVGYVLSAVCGGFISAALAGFKEEHPNISFQLARSQTVTQFKGLIDGSLDVGFSRTPHRFPTGLTGFTVDRQRFFLVLPERHRLASRNQITPALLVNESFVAAPLEMELGFWSNINSVAPPGVSLRVVERANDVFTVLALVAAGAGISVLSESLACIAMPGVAFREIVGMSRTSDHSAVFRKNETAPVVKSFISYLRSRSRAS